MKKILLIALLLLTQSVFSQAVFQKVFEKTYSELGISPRIENCGIYGIASFDVSENTTAITLFDRPVTLLFGSKGVSTIENRTGFKDNLISLDGIKSNKLSSLINEADAGYIKLKEINTAEESIFTDDGGIMTNLKGESIKVCVNDRNTLKVILSLKNNSNEIKINFPGDLGCADLIGMDKKGNLFLEVERYLSEIPLVVKKEIYTVAGNGEVLSVLSVPSIKYMQTVRDYKVDNDGNLFHIIYEKEKVSIVKWSGLTSKSKQIINYPAEFNYTLNYNNFCTSKEPAGQPAPDGFLTAASRVDAVKLGEQYALHKYICSSSNLAPNGRTALDGDIVKTPSWLREGTNARIPYKWGGFNTLTQYNAGLLTGKTAGDINTEGVSDYAVGVDCSGFVSRCWQLSSHYATSMMPSISTQYANWNMLKPGDAILKSGHVRLFLSRTSNGSFRVVESAARVWDVSYWTFALSDLDSIYKPVAYNNMTNDYSFAQPRLISAINVAPGKVRLTWECDSTNTKGFRLYMSENGINWTVIKNETELTGKEITISRTKNTELYRVSSVLNNAQSTESMFSNSLVSSEFSGTKKVLIVDGFQRNMGSWRNTGHTFANNYALGLKPLSVNFESIKNTFLDSISLTNYDAVYWILGDESTVEETFSNAEQLKVKAYLEAGGKLFVSGSEIGWDLFGASSATAQDKDFYNNYLKAAYISDNSGSNVATGNAGTYFGGMTFNFGQTYVEDYPDEIGISGGSKVCMKYGNNKGAGVHYTGTFGSSSIKGKVVYFSFPLETTANDSMFNEVIKGINSYFDASTTDVETEALTVKGFDINGNYPNPFNNSTVINFTSPFNGNYTFEIFSVLGEKLQTLSGVLNSGVNELRFTGDKLSSGVYFYKISINDNSGNTKSLTRKMNLLK